MPTSSVVSTRGSRLWMFFAILGFCFIARAQSASPDLRGIYIYTNDVSQLTPTTAAALSSSLNVQGIDGVAVVIGWNAIEPSMGQYQWTLLDQWINQVVAIGKKIDLVVPAGSAMPAWLFQPAPAGAGATQLNFTISPHAGETGVCDTANMAAPWDPAFLSQWDSMLAALSAHLKSAGTYNAVTLVRLTGINRTTEELRLPRETPQSTGLSCVSDAIATWAQDGYRPSLVSQAWTTILGSFQKSFPDKPFSVSIIATDGAFPPIGEDGLAIVGARPNFTQQLISTASQKFPGRLVVQYDFLMPGEPDSPDVITAAQTLGTMAAFQTNEYLGGQGAACSEPVTNPTPCNSTTYLQLLQGGIYPLGQNNPLEAQYIEVFHDNATSFADDILTAHLELEPPAISLVANAEGEKNLIAPNTWIEIKGSELSLPGDTRIWKTLDFANNQLPTSLDRVSVTVNGKDAYVYYISPNQVNVLTPPDAISGPVAVQLSINKSVTSAFTVQSQAVSPSFFVFSGGPYVAATHVDGTYIGPATLIPGSTTPAKPGETVVLYANGFGPTSTPVVSGSMTQSGALSPLPVITIGGAPAMVQFAALVAPGEFQFNVVVPSTLADGDQSITATYNGSATQGGALITVQH